MRKEIDMHIHTGRYDGEGTPKEIADKIAKETNLAGGILLDHDMLPPYYIDIDNKVTLEEYGKQIGIFLDGAVEITVETYIENVHLLWYNFDFSKCKEIECYFSLARKSKQRAYKKMCDNLLRAGYKIRYEDLVQDDVEISRLDILNQLIKMQYCPNITEAKKLLENKNNIAYIERMSIDEGIQFIHSFGGIAILAHPLLIEKKYQSEIIDKAARAHIDGFELFYPFYENGLLQYSNNEAIKTMNDIIENLSLKYHRDWLVSGGSDFHGSKKTNVSIGDGRIDDKYFLCKFVSKPEVCI